MSRRQKPGDVLVERLRNLYGVKNDTALARELGVKPPSVQGWRNTGKLGAKTLYRVAYTKDLRVEWLETGEGEKYRGEVETVASLPRPIQELVEGARRLDDVSHVLTIVKILIEGNEDLKNGTLAFI